MRHLSPLATAVIVLLTAAQLMAQGVDQPAPEVSAQEVQEAITRGVKYLYSIQNDRFTWDDFKTVDEAIASGQGQASDTAKREFGGRTALAVLALLYAGEDPRKEPIQKALKFLAEIETNGTYATSIRASVWSKLKDPKLKPLLARDASWIVEAMTRPDGDIPGHLSYEKPHPGFNDYSNTQYGVLGLRDAAIRGVEIPRKYWEAIQTNMIDGQASNGGWAYHYVQKDDPKLTYGAMTVGCLANLYITQHMLQRYNEGRFNGRSTPGCGMSKPPEAIAKALAWMDRNLPVDFGLKTGGDVQTVKNQGQHGMGRYYLYGIERCASATGRKTFGGVNWFQKGAKKLLAEQDPDGGWKATYFGNQVHTAWGLLFLAKAQGPVFYNKLDTRADWNNHPYAMPNLAEYLGEELEQRVNWQVVDIDDPVEEWLDAPVLYFTGHDIPQFTDEQKKKLRLYTDSGGTILAEACCSKTEFVRGFHALAKDVWPEWELQTLDRKHPVFEFHHPIRGRAPTAMHINDGCRSRVFFFLQDGSGAWNQDMRSSYLTYFQLGLNLARYASDKASIRSRLYYTPPVLKEMAAQGKAVPTPGGAGTVKLADWPAEGKRLTDIRGMRHLAETLRDGFGVTPEMTTIEDGDLSKLDGIQVLHLSGHYSFNVSDENVAKLKAFLDRGGLLWADAQCGREAFNESFEKLLEKVVPGAKSAAVTLTDDLMTGTGLPRAGFDVAAVRYKQVLGLKVTTPVLREVRIGDRRAIVYSTYDLTCGLDGHACANCMGPVRNDALKIASNIVLSVMAKE